MIDELDELTPEQEAEQERQSQRAFDGIAQHLATNDERLAQQKEKKR